MKSEVKLLAVAGIGFAVWYFLKNEKKPGAASPAPNQNQQTAGQIWSSGGGGRVPSGGTSQIGVPTPGANAGTTLTGGGGGRAAFGGGSGRADFGPYPSAGGNNTAKPYTPPANIGDWRDPEPDYTRHTVNDWDNGKPDTGPLQPAPPPAPINWQQPAAPGKDGGGMRVEYVDKETYDSWVAMGIDVSNVRWR